MGSGGVGGYFGLRLAKGGADVHFVARGAHLAAMRAHGLTVESAHEPLRLEPVEVTDDPATIGPVDVVLFGVKLWDTEPAARAILPLIGLDTAVISFQNGVQKDDTLRPIVGREFSLAQAALAHRAVMEPGAYGKIVLIP